MAEARTILTDLRIWNGENLLEDDTLILQGPRIERLCRRSALDAGEARAARSLAGTTALPGLMDAHVHMVLDPSRKDPPAPGEHGDPQAMRERAAMMVRAGITTARDLGGGGWLELELRDAIARGETPGPRLLCSGQPVTSVGGHCHFWGGEAQNLETARKVIDRQRAHGVDLIKVMATGGRFTRGSKPGAPQFPARTLAGIVAYARDHDLTVAAHCHGTTGIDHAVQAGVHTVEHCSWVGEGGWASDYQPSVAARMVDAGTWVSPTINRGWQRMIDAHSQTINRMRAALVDMRAKGVPLVASTDAGIPGVFHHDLPAALAVFAAVADLSAEAVLRTATSQAALALGLAGSTGRLSEGFAADLLVVEGNPLDDLSGLTRPLGVWAAGRSVRTP